MCGIAGMINLAQKPIELGIVQMMTDAMVHRGPDAAGYFLDGFVALGHRRLSIIDLSESANQPFSDSSGRFQLVFNGELYNFRDIRKSIPDHTFKTSSDTEVLIENFARKGIGCIHDFKGMFAFAVWDKNEKTLTLVRDRLGIKPLYYYVKGDTFIFASEIRAILQSGFVSRKLNHSALGDYFSFQSVTSPHTLVEGIRQLKAGHYIVIKDGTFQERQYWNITNQKVEYDFSNVSIVRNKIYNLLSNAVEQRLISDVPVGAFLSGGIDSSAIVGLMSRVSSKKPETFNISFGEKDYDESDYAKLIADRFKTNHHQLKLTPAYMLAELENALDALDSPSGDGINSYIVSKAVKQAGVTVALSGIGGDELFAGYPFFLKYYRLQQNSNLWNRSMQVRRGLGLALNVYKGKPAFNKLQQLLKTDSTDIDDIYPVMRQVIPKELSGKIIKNGIAIKPYMAQQLAEAAPAIKAFPWFSQVSIAEYMGYTQQTLLRDCDQMSMAVSLELREPFFDFELVQYVLNIPDVYKYPDSPKKLLVDSLNGLLPEDITTRKKQGFTFPWNSWLKNELRCFCDVRIQRMAARDFIKPKELLSLWKDFLKGDKMVNWMYIWLFVVLECWLENNGVE